MCATILKKITIFLILCGISVTTTGAAAGHHHNSHHKVHHGGGGSSPRIGAVLKNFKGENVKVLTENYYSDVVMPKLDVEDYIWEGFSIQLNCHFHKPVQWVYHGDGAPIVKTETHRFAPNIHNESSFTFGANVIFTHTNYRQTGQYSCQDIQTPSVQTSLFVYVPGSRIFVSDDKEGSILNSNNNSNSATDESVSALTIHGPAHSNNRRIKLPCSVSSPNVSVQLFKDGRAINKSGKDVFYDPKVGFEISQDSVSSPWGRYECVEEYSNQRLVIHVKPPKYVLPSESFNNNDENKIAVYSENPFQSSIKHAHIKFHHDKRRNVLACCAYDGQGKRLSQFPVMKSASCDSLSECKILENRLEKTSCAVKRACHGKRLKQRCVGYELPEFDDAGLIECSVGHTREFFQFSKVGDTLITNFDSVPRTDDILEIITEDSPTTPGKTTFTCLANSFFFSQGLQWALEMENGSLHFLHERHPSKISIELSPEEASRVHCFAPVWDSFQWRNVSVLYPESLL